MVAAAVIGAAVVGAGATAYAGSEAAGATKSASNAAISEQQQALNQQAALSAPYRQFGESAIPTLQSLLGLSGPGGAGAGTGIGGANTPQYSIGGAGQINQLVSAPSPAIPTPTGQGAPVNAVQTAGGPVSIAAGGGAGAAGGVQSPVSSVVSGLAADPMFQFAQQQGTQSAVNAATAQGLGLSGNTLEALSKFNQGLASETYQQYVGDLMNVVGTGQAAAAGQAANIGNAANNISNTLYNQGQTQAGIDVNTIAGITKSLGGAANQLVENQTLKGLYDPNSSSRLGFNDPTASVNYSYGPGSVGTTTNFEDPGFGLGTTTTFDQPLPVG